MHVLDRDCRYTRAVHWRLLDGRGQTSGASQGPSVGEEAGRHDLRVDIWVRGCVKLASTILLRLSIPTEFKVMNLA